ncbi:MAG: prolipoprotein diacylglyceryl transferase [Gammaproteobacteria bacterium]
MLTFHTIDPVALSMGSVKIHWYGIMYLIAFASAWALARWRAGQPNSGWNAEQVADVIFFGAVGVILGGRIGYMLFYNFAALLENPLALFKLWEGGMSFHGGLLGVLLAMFLYGRKVQKSFFEITDFIAPLVPVGLGAGRMGNFINGELWGRITDVPWAMLYPRGGNLPRHPSELYEFFLEGIVLFIILWVYSAKPKPRMAVSGVFLVGYGILRSIAECFREPDAHLGFLAFDSLTMGQLLSFPMIVLGGFLLWRAYCKK